MSYKGNAQALVDLMGGQIAMMFDQVSTSAAQVKGGKLRALATVGAKRTPALPDYPTIAESGLPGFGVDNWYGLFLPAGTDKSIAHAAQALRPRPWTIAIDGMVDKPLEIGIDDLIRKMPLEERLYRHRCVEAWGMAIPWTGFPLSRLVDFAKPASSAKYVRMETFLDPSTAPGQRQRWHPWPYVEGLTMAEATNELTFMVTGAYGKPAPKSMGAPIRLATPWKYGFKSVKSIVKFTFTDQRPKSFWENLQASEYGFWANVNPQVAHPRWSQATEEFIGTGERKPTMLFNGYGDSVADLYTGLDKERLWA